MHPKTSFAFGLAASVLLAACGGNGASVTSAATSPSSMPSAPAITVQPSDQSVSSGQPATFTVTATGTGTLSYQWEKNAVPIAGATAPIYTTPAAALGDSGSVFAVAVSNANGSTASRSAKLLVASGAIPAGTDVLTYKNDLSRTGQNLTESTLTLANVNSAGFGLLRNLMVDGKVDAQPLYVSQLIVSGSQHNVVFVATEHDSVYAFDADTGSVLWHASLLASGETLSDTHGCSQVVPEIGITSTPVIDRNAGAHGTLYVVAMSKDASSAYHQRLHALDLVTGAELLNGPAEIAATYPTAGGGTSTFSPGQYEERAALLLLNGTVYTSWTSHCDGAPYYGWIIAYSASTLSRTAVLNVAPNSGGAGPAIWMSGGGPAADSAGNIYLLTANGAFETALDANGFPKNQDFGNSFLKLSTAGGSLSVADYFAMYNEVAESAADEDLGSGGAMLLPDMTDSTNTVTAPRHRSGQGRQHLRRQSRRHGKIQSIRQRPDLAASERRAGRRRFLYTRLFQRDRLLRRRRRHAESVHDIERQARGGCSIPVRDSIRFSGHRSGGICKRDFRRHRLGARELQSGGAARL